MKENWFLIGDIHGSATPIRYFYEENNERLQLDESKNTIILLGDVACNYHITGWKDRRLKERLSKMPFTYICLRGNHEARASVVCEQFRNNWHVEEKYGGNIYVENDFPNIEYLSDEAAIYEFAGYKTFSVPGAYSVDKFYRIINGWQWFEDEQLSEEEMQRARELVAKEKSVDLIISHTCPLAYEPRDLFLSYIDQSEVDKAMEIFLNEIDETLDYKRWAWGHFHADRLYPWDGDKEKMMLLNEKVIDLKKFMEMRKNDYWHDILA